MADNKQIETAKRVAQHASQLAVVEAVALAGSSATGHMTAQSDIDVYIYCTRDLTMTERNTIAGVDSRGREVIDYWGPGDVWYDTQTGVEVDAVYFTTHFIEDQLRSNLDQHQGRMGYTTAFWYTVSVSKMLFDRSGWFANLQIKADQPYPDALVKNIIAQNYPLLRDIIPSYKHKIEKALSRGDIVSLNRDVSGFLGV